MKKVAVIMGSDSDLPVVQAITLIFTIVIIVTNLIVELVYSRLNVKGNA